MAPSGRKNKWKKSWKRARKLSRRGVTNRQLYISSDSLTGPNNLGYENKGSIQINDGEWIELNHTDIDKKEIHYKGMLRSGMNSIHFAYFKHTFQSLSSRSL